MALIFAYQLFRMAMFEVFESLSNVYLVFTRCASRRAYNDTINRTHIRTRGFHKGEP